MAAPLYESSTRRGRLEDLPPPLVAAVRSHAERASIDLHDSSVWCTHRRNPASSSFFGKLLGRRNNPTDPDPEHTMALVLHRTHLLVGRHAASGAATVLSLPLLAATATRGSSIAAAFGGALDAPADDGITIAGFPGTEGRPGSYFFGLGGPEADACFEAVRAAIGSAKNP